MITSFNTAKKIGILIMIFISAAMTTDSHATTQSQTGETWMGIYFGASKMGYAKMKIAKSVYKGKPGYKLDTLSVTRMLVLGEQVEQSVDSTVYLDSKSAPLYQAFKMSSSGHSTIITAGYSQKEIVAHIESDGTTSSKSIPVPPGCKLVGDSTFFSPTLKIKVGDKMDLKCFNPLTLSLDDIQTTVLRKESLKLNGKAIETYVIVSSTPLGEMICWQDNKGDLLKVTALMGITMVKEPKETAIAIPVQSLGYAPPDDLAVMTSAHTNREIPGPRQVSRLSIKFVGMKDKSLAISDARQKAQFHEDDNPYVEYDISADEFDPQASIELPVKDAGMSAFLGDTPYIQPTNPEIFKTAADIVGDEKNAYKAAAKIRAWVFANMRTKGSIGILRSSVDVLHAKEGVCRDYAVLYTALARAAGIPAKVVAGLIYWRNGFYYHAWSEAYIGKWIPMDATLPTDFVDATHIKLSVGEATDMFTSIRTMGALKADVLTFEYQQAPPE